ncbi:MAG: DUF58 domain-containing protein [Pseudomonadota bacterium]
MWSDRTATAAAEHAATQLSLEDLIAMQPRHLRGPLAPGQRIPGGERLGRGRAQSLEFDGLSPYTIGDDVRWIDWRASARTGRTQVKRFAAESHRARLIVLDLSPALFFGTQTRLMAKTAALLAARLAWESVLLQEPVTLSAPGLTAERPRRGRRHVLGLMDRLSRAYAEDQMPAETLSETLNTTASLIGRGDEICLIGEFAELGDDFAAVSRALSEVRTLRALVLEDPMLRAELPGSHYPARHPETRARQVLHIGTPDGAAMPETAAKARTERRRTLQDLGWQVTDALDLLPREAGA